MNKQPLLDIELMQGAIQAPEALTRTPGADLGHIHAITGKSVTWLFSKHKDDFISMSYTDYFKENRLRRRSVLTGLGF